MDVANPDANPASHHGRLVLIVWAMLAAIVVGVVLTYSRFPPDEFYNVSYTGLKGALGRALVYSNYPVALISIAILGAAVLAMRSSSWWRDSSNARTVSALSVLALVLCLVAAAPGVVDDGNLDAKWVNAVPLAGVVLALFLSILSLRQGAWGRGDELAWQDRAGIVIVAILAIIALPWVIADFGGYADNLPVIGGLYYASEIPEGETLRAVHIGHHHGVDGFLFAASAFLLNRATREHFSGRLATLLSAYLALMVTYGVANIANDAWLEQLVKRGWVEYEIPTFYVPGLSGRWAIVLVATMIVWVLLFRPTGAPHHESDLGDSRSLAGHGAKAVS
jgi:hypothetical protein